MVLAVKAWQLRQAARQALERRRPGAGTRARDRGARHPKHREWGGVTVAGSVVEHCTRVVILLLVDAVAASARISAGAFTRNACPHLPMNSRHHLAFRQPTLSSPFSGFVCCSSWLPKFGLHRSRNSDRRRQKIRTNGAPGMTRTCDLLVRSQTLYPTELRARLTVFATLPI